MFLGTRHPNPDVPQHAVAHQAVELARQQGSLEHSVYFLEWLPYDDFTSVLAEAAAGVSLHPVHVETHFSIRKRLMDYLWARLPVVTTEGDVASEWIRQYGFGVTVPPHDREAVLEAVVQVLNRPRAEWYAAYPDFASEHYWKRVVEPLRRSLMDGRKAADAHIQRVTPNTASSPKSSFYRALFILRSQGISALFHRGWRYLQWRLAQFR